MLRPSRLLRFFAQGQVSRPSNKGVQEATEDYRLTCHMLQLLQSYDDPHVHVTGIVHICPAGRAFLSDVLKQLS